MKQNGDPQYYRPNVGLAIFSGLGHVFLGRRMGSYGPFQWQMPQGGIDRGEQPEVAAMRELFEETGIRASAVDIMEETSDWLYYEFPPTLRHRLNGPYIGQRQKWFALKFKGAESDIRLDLAEPEFDAWRWAKLDETPAEVIPFKRPIYEEVVKRFSKYTATI